MAQEPGPRLPGPPRVVLIGPESAGNLAIEIAEELEFRYGMEPKALVEKSGEGPSEIAGLEALASADLLILFTQSREWPKNQAERLKRYVEAGRPLIVLGPSLQAQKGTAGLLEAQLVSEKAALEIAVVPEADNHEIMKEIPRRYSCEGPLYDVRLAPGATPLFAVTAGGAAERPVAWTYQNPSGGKVFATTLPDLKCEGFRRLFFNAVFWLQGEWIPDAPI